jgi:23S rRNA-/tRNA-specific pseudouridylate synthase
MQGEWKSKIRSLDDRKFQKHKAGELAVTRYKVIEQRKKFSIVEIEPVTGRTNQIRIQFSDKGHPLVGERKYAFARDYELKFRRVALHSSKIGWVDPLNGKKIEVTSNLPHDMEVFLARN